MWGDPLWPTVPHWLSACQTNCFGWRLAGKAAWSGTQDPVQRTRVCIIGIMGWSHGFTGPCSDPPWTHCSHSPPPVLIHTRDNFTATFQLLNYDGVAGCVCGIPLSPNIKIAPGCRFPLWIHLWSCGPFPLKGGWKEELGFPTERHPHSRSWCFERSRE